MSFDKLSLDESLYSLIWDSYSVVVVGADRSIFGLDYNLSPSENDLDSRRFITMVMLIEQNITSSFGVEVSLIKEEIFNEHNFVFRSVGSLVNYLKNEICKFY